MLLVAHDALLFGVIIAAAELMTPVTNSIVVGFRVALAPDRLQGRVQAAARDRCERFARVPASANASGSGRHAVDRGVIDGMRGLTA